MLEKKERSLMRVIYDKGYVKGVAVISPNEIISNLPEKLHVDGVELKSLIRTLEFEDYIETTNTVKGGKDVYLFTLKQKGLAFKRAEEDRKKAILSKVILTVGSATLGYFIKVILDLIFNG